MKHLKKDVVRLAATYLTIIMVMSVGFSIVFIRRHFMSLIVVRAQRLLCPKEMEI
ncbi:hypothetical protein IPF89_03835 [Candidatus Saccharibacteria bacterium]|nr:MAG: hypothetical protein IPF89_03835 [Candidatus Saccharibacteria bacterium]